MAREVLWTVPVYEEFLRLAYLTEFQKQVMDMHIRRCSIVEIALALNASESSVNRAIRQCKDIYDAVQPHSDILQPRGKLNKM